MQWIYAGWRRRCYMARAGSRGRMAERLEQLTPLRVCAPAEIAHEEGELLKGRAAPRPRGAAPQPRTTPERDARLPLSALDGVGGKQVADHHPVGPRDK